MSGAHGVSCRILNLPATPPIEPQVGYSHPTPDTTNGTAIGLPISWGGARGVNGAAVLWQSQTGRAWAVPSEVW